MDQLRRKKNGKGTMDDLYRSMFSSNMALFTESEQDKLRTSSVAIAGMGGVGGLLAERLVRFGIGHLKILDPGTFQHNSLNRQFGSSMLNLGQNRAEAVFEEIKEINPQALLECSKTGIATENDAERFLVDCDLVIDEMEFGSLKESIILQRVARRKGIYYLFAVDIGFGALVVIFDPKGMTLEEYDKLPPDLEFDDVEKFTVPLERLFPVIPSYVSYDSSEAHNLMREILAGKRPAPTNSIGVGLASIMASAEAINIFLAKRAILSAPKYTYIDLLDRQLLVEAVS